LKLTSLPYISIAEIQIELNIVFIYRFYDAEKY